jgi:hypothetical protein
MNYTKRFRCVKKCELANTGGNKMKTIYKYTLKSVESNIVNLPLSTQVLSIESQGDTIVFYGLIDTEEKETVSYNFKVFGTGHEIGIDVNTYKFLGTVKIYSGTLMFHVFYKQLDE